jgi:hypothetical protein
MSGLSSNAITSDRQGIAVRNGVISGAGSGVVFTGSGVVEGLRLRGSAGNNGIFVGSGIVKGNIVSGYIVGIDARGTVTGNLVEFNRLGISIVQGSTVIGNTVLNNSGGIVVNCPANVTDNTAVDNGGPVFGNLVLRGEGCNNTNNVAP